MRRVHLKLVKIVQLTLLFWSISRVTCLQVDKRSYRWLWLIDRWVLGLSYSVLSSTFCRAYHMRSWFLSWGSLLCQPFELVVDLFYRKIHVATFIDLWGCLNFWNNKKSAVVGIVGWPLLVSFKLQKSDTGIVKDRKLRIKILNCIVESNITNQSSKSGHLSCLLDML